MIECGGLGSMAACEGSEALAAWRREAFHDACDDAEQEADNSAAQQHAGRAAKPHGCRRGGRPVTWIGGGGMDPKKLAGLGVPMLRALFAQVFGQQTASNNASWLRRKLAEPPDAVHGQKRSPIVRARDVGAAIWNGVQPVPGCEGLVAVGYATGSRGRASSSSSARASTAARQQQQQLVELLEAADQEDEDEPAAAGVRLTGVRRHSPDSCEVPHSPTASPALTAFTSPSLARHKRGHEDAAPSRQRARRPKQQQQQQQRRRPHVAVRERDEEEEDALVSVASFGPQLVGRCVCVFWPADNKWWPATVCHADAALQLLHVLYADLTEERIAGGDLTQLLASGHLRLAPENAQAAAATAAAAAAAAAAEAVAGPASTDADVSLQAWVSADTCEPIQSCLMPLDPTAAAGCGSGGTGNHSSAHSSRDQLLRSSSSSDGSGEGDEQLVPKRARHQAERSADAITSPLVACGTAGCSAEFGSGARRVSAPGEPQHDGELAAADSSKLGMRFASQQLQQLHLQQRQGQNLELEQQLHLQMRQQMAAHLQAQAQAEADAEQRRQSKRRQLEQELEQRLELRLELELQQHLRQAMLCQGPTVAASSLPLAPTSVAASSCCMVVDAAGAVQPMLSAPMAFTPAPLSLLVSKPSLPGSPAPGSYAGSPHASGDAVVPPSYELCQLQQLQQRLQQMVTDSQPGSPAGAWPRPPQPQPQPPAASQGPLGAGQPDACAAAATAAATAAAAAAVLEGSAQACCGLLGGAMARSVSLDAGHGLARSAQLQRSCGSCGAAQLCGGLPHQMGAAAQHAPQQLPAAFLGAGAAVAPCSEPSAAAAAAAFQQQCCQLECAAAQRALAQRLAACCGGGLAPRADVPPAPPCSPVRRAAAGAGTFTAGGLSGFAGGVSARGAGDEVDALLSQPAGDGLFASDEPGLDGALCSMEVERTRTPQLEGQPGAAAAGDELTTSSGGCSSADLAGDCACNDSVADDLQQLEVAAGLRPSADAGQTAPPDAATVLAASGVAAAAAAAALFDYSHVFDYA